MKGLIFTIFALVAITQAARDWSKIKPNHLHVMPRIPVAAPKIVGGEEAEPHGVAFQAAVIASNGGFCGGSIISEQAVLTAAHCVDTALSAEVILGAHKIREEEDEQQIIQSARIKVHEDWDPYNIVDDIAIIFLSNRIKIDRTARITELNREDTSLDGEEALVSGWGRYSDTSGSLSDVLRFAVSNIISNQECERFFGIFIKETNVCLDGSNGKGSCNGDSGGPLFIKRNDAPVQAGIVSFGTGLGCEKGHPTVYTRVSKYISWIEKQIY